MLEGLFEIICETLLQLVLETLAEFGLHAIAEPFWKTQNPMLAAIGHAILGAVFGGLSLLIVPTHLVTHVAWRAATLFFTPIAVGFAMVAIGALRAKRGQNVLRIDRFAYGYLFALGLALVRFFFAR